MDVKRFARVVAVGAKASCGTGYLLDGARVLTARHVVEDAETLTVQYDDLTGRRTEKKAELIWQGEDDLDVAVLRIETDLRIARQLFRPEPLARDQGWRSRGWARASPPPPDDDSSVLAALTALRGTAAESVKAARRVELDVESPPENADWWRGISGAPVFCGWQLVGVIEGGPQAFAGGRIWAVPLAALWDAPGFREAIGYDASVDELREARRRQLLDDLTDLLRKHPKATLAIAAEKTAWKDLRTDPEALAESLCSSQSWREVLDAFDSAHEQLSRQGGAEAEHAAKAVVQILERALPEVYGSTSLDVTASGDGGHLITLPVETETLAELAMAAFDGRCLAYEEVRAQQDYPAGIVRFPLPDEKLERGFDPQSDQAWLEWLELLAKWVKLPAAKVQALGGTLPPTPPLTSDARLVPALRRRLASEVPSRELDVAALAEMWSRGRPVRRLPWRPLAAWAPKIVVLVDRSARLVPFWDDQDRLLRRLRRRLGRASLHEVYYLEGWAFPWRDDRNRYRWPAAEPGSPVLALSDLGFLAGEADRAELRRGGARGGTTRRRRGSRPEAARR